MMSAYTQENRAFEHSEGGMPNEERQEQPEQEVTLTPEDRERLADLFDEINQLRRPSLAVSGDYEEGGRAQVEGLHNRLREEGRRAAIYILERASDPSRGRYFGGLFDDIHQLEYCASSAEAKKLGELLLDDRICLDPDRSNKVNLLYLLGKVGTAENAEQLVRCNDKLLSGNVYRGGDSAMFLSFDNENIISTLGDILARTTDEQERARIQDAIFRILQDIQNNGLQYEHARGDERAAQDRNIDWGNTDQEDRITAEEYKQARFNEAETRLDVVRRLRHEIEKERGIIEEPEDDKEEFLYRHYLEYYEKNPSPYAPTLGIEIEIRENTVIPPRIKEIRNQARELHERMTMMNDYSDEYRALSEKYEEFMEPYENWYAEAQGQYIKTREMGVPKGHDAFWEFAHKPVRGYLTFSREVQALIEMGLINKESRRHSLHLTVGGITSEGAVGRSAFLLARALEASGWSTTGGRLLRPYLTGKGAWNVKGIGGVRERRPSELELGTKKAIELRTFQLQSLSGLNRLLRSAFLLGAALKSHQEKLQGEPLGEKVTEENRNKLAAIWADFAKKCADIFEEFDLRYPGEAWSGPDNYDGKAEREKNEFVPFASLLDEARKSPDSRGAEFVKKMRGLIIQTRKKAAEIVYPRGELKE